MCGQRVQALHASRHTASRNTVQLFDELDAVAIGEIGLMRGLVVRRNLGIIKHCREFSHDTVRLES